ncbi:NADH-quinone oxidoreductase subunit L [Rhodobacteraceae bacterium 2CG4]|uniref:NADH-quinone oxidoreductase subunit L n=1 Tax=Halovulum marinum TaxID=2662447 RepID=A0A6L5YYI0_9RHOB|nr:NADH-quinone oxidoreductase subunit L [Halovulum marinum]MSU88932.1 NADH-quinone oxidoreductase subunit L [Halovulum marinum]
MATIILFAPLVGALICGFGHRFIGEKAATMTATALLFLSALLSWVVFLGHDGDQVATVELFRWIESGSMSAYWAVRLDTLTAVMLVVITTVSALVHLYSVGYMAHDENWKKGESYCPRFFAYLSFFTFAMLMLVTADNLVQMFFGWEGVGVASYLLIGFYYRKPSANNAAMKAFIVNRVGDFGFALGIFALFYLTDSIQFDVIFGAAPDLAATSLSFLWMQVNAAELIAVLLFIGAMGKSAQLFLHTWLPDAMEGPTPVSALIHAATMVTAGVFLVVRMSPLFEYAPGALTMVTVIGASTAFFAATVGLVQNDIKRVIAYSTCSQLGYMFAAAGVGFYQAAMFHLFTHAAFKALLFLGAGSVITAMHHEQDMRNYGGLKDKVPLTFWTMIIGTLAITGVGIPFSYDLVGVPIGLAGFVSKDAIIEGVYAGNSVYAFGLLLIAALFTSFYSWRLIFMTFYGEPRGDMHAHEHAHESPRVMTVPLVVLAVGAVLLGTVYYKPFVGSSAEKFFGPSVYNYTGAEASDHAAAPAADTGADPAADSAADSAAEPEAPAVARDQADAPAADAHAAGDGAAAADLSRLDEREFVLHAYHGVPEWVKLAPFVAMLLGLGTAYLFYIARPELPGRLAAANPGLYRFLLNKWYFDELYDVLFVRPARAIGRFLWKQGDGATIDGGINGLAMGVVPFFTRVAARVQSGYVFHYAFAMFIGLAALLTWILLRAFS